MARASTTRAFWAPSSAHALCWMLSSDNASCRENEPAQPGQSRRSIVVCAQQWSYLRRRCVFQACAARFNGCQCCRTGASVKRVSRRQHERSRSSHAAHRAASDAAAFSRKRWLRAAFSRIYAASRPSPTVRASASSSAKPATRACRRCWLATTWRSHIPAAGAAGEGRPASPAREACEAANQPPCQRSHSAMVNAAGGRTLHVSRARHAACEPRVHTLRTSYSAVNEKARKRRPHLAPSLDASLGHRLARTHACSALKQSQQQPDGFRTGRGCQAALTSAVQSAPSSVRRQTQRRYTCWRERATHALPYGREYGNASKRQALLPG